MTRSSQADATLIGTASDVARNSYVRALAVGDPQEWKQRGYALPREGIVFLSFSDVTQETMDHLRPGLVVSPVLSNTFDCVDLAVQLYRVGFSGEYRAISTGLPKPEVIEREVRQMCTQLDFRIIERL
ncbi:MAG: hypothetical protein AAFY31_02410 [Pseudomonadota bacterium]